MVLPSANASQLGGSAAPLSLVGLPPLMGRTSGSPAIAIGLIDGPVVIGHPDLTAENVKHVAIRHPGVCTDAGDAACAHGTFIAGILLARRGSGAPGICPECSLLVSPIFAAASPAGAEMPSAASEELAEAIVAVTEAGARIINLSAALVTASARGERELWQALDFALLRGVVVVAAAGNEGAVGSSAITRHPWVIPVVAYDLRGRPMGLSNLGASIGRRGLGAPGEAVTSLGAAQRPLTMSGTSVATPFVAGAVALLWSEFSDATAAEVRAAVIEVAAPRRSTIVPPLLQAWAGYQAMSKARS